MKKLLVIGMMALATGAFGEMSLTEARGKIADVVMNPAMMQEVMSELSAEDQVQFLAQVNQAIDKFNASAEEKAMLYNDINSYAMRNAKKGNLTALLAEMFATVPPEYLTVLNETFAANLFSRSIDPSVQISDKDFEDRAKIAMSAIQDRASETDESAVRTTFGILMFLRASEGTPADLRQTLVSMIPDASIRNIALNEWIPAAMGEGVDKTYEPMLGASDAGEQPKLDVQVVISQNQSQLLLNADSSGSTPQSYAGVVVGGGPSSGMPNSASRPIGVQRVPQSDKRQTPWYYENDRSTKPEHKLYKWQTNE